MFVNVREARKGFHSQPSLFESVAEIKLLLHILRIQLHTKALSCNKEITVVHSYSVRTLRLGKRSETL